MDVVSHYMGYLLSHDVVIVSHLPLAQASNINLLPSLSLPPSLYDPLRCHFIGQWMISEKRSEDIADECLRSEQREARHLAGMTDHIT